MNKLRLLLTILLLFMSLAGKAESNTNTELDGKGKPICLIYVFMNNFGEQHSIMLDDEQWLMTETDSFIEGVL
jgi:hypothetical protein